MEDEEVVGRVELAQLFRTCDRQQRGYIDRQEFSELCANFQIQKEDAGTIFEDLDRDQDERISLEDFTRGFRDFLSPQQQTNSPEQQRSAESRKKQTLRRQGSAAKAWLHFADRLGHNNIRYFLTHSADRLYGLYEELHLSPESVPPQLVVQFESLMDSLVSDARQLEQEREKFEQALKREREQHQMHLKSLEDELEIQVQRVAAVVKHDAELKFEGEKRELQFNLEAEIVQLQAHLALFKKVENWMNREKPQEAMKDQLEVAEKAASENRQLKLSLMEAQTTLALLQTELTQLKSHYTEKDRLLHCEKEAMTDIVKQQEHIRRQLELLQDANRSLQDTNDSLRANVDFSTPVRRSPVPSYYQGDHGSLMNFMGSTRPSPSSQPESVSGLSLMVPEELLFQNSTEDSGHSSLVNEGLPDVNSVQVGQQRLQQPFRRSFRRSVGPPSIQNEFLIDQQRYSRQYEPDGGPADRSFRVVFAGDAAVGKSSFITRLTSDVFVPHTITTLGVDFKVKTIRVDERNIVIQLWDTAGQERFRSITQSYFRKADGVILAFDVTNERSFLNVRHWADCLSDCLPADKVKGESSCSSFPLVLIGTKADLRSQSLTTCVDPAQAERLAHQLRAQYVETSAKNGVNLLEALVILTRQMMVTQDDEVQTLKLTDFRKARSAKCC